jgi:class 3 adenylate cyclase
VDRRPAAIFASDIAGYGRLMGADEEGTLRQLKAHRKELVDRKIIEHHGRIVKTTGDGMLVEFVSVVDAVRCAVDIQRGIARACDLRAEVVPLPSGKRVTTRWVLSFFREVPLEQAALDDLMAFENPMVLESLEGKQ